MELSKHAQIIALTTQLSELKTELHLLSKNNKTNLNDKTPLSEKKYGNFEAWRLTKVNNNVEFNMVEKNDKNFYWCDQHQYPNCETKGMYVLHKPAEHDAWKARKDELNKKRGKKNGPPTTTPMTVSPPASASNASTNASKLSLAKSFQEALTTTAGLSEDQFQKIWQSCCDASGN